MPKHNTARQVEHERHLADRVKAEREARGWTLEDLARRMTAAGCPMDRSAIHRVENGKPPRRITVDEAVTFANVFGLQLTAMLLPLGIAKGKEATRLFARHQKLWQQFEDTAAALREVEAALLDLADEGYEQQVLNALRASGSAIGDVTLDTWRIINGRAPQELIDRLSAVTLTDEGASWSDPEDAD